VIIPVQRQGADRNFGEFQTARGKPDQRQRQFAIDRSSGQTANQVADFITDHLASLAQEVPPAMQIRPNLMMDQCRQVGRFSPTVKFDMEHRPRRCIDRHGYYPGMPQAIAPSYRAISRRFAASSPIRRNPVMAFILPPLPFARDALAPHMSGETLDYHHGKHHKAYVDKTNELAGPAGLGEASLLDVIRASKPGPLRNNAAQLWNHSFFWLGLSADAPPPSGQLAALIDSGFGSVDALIKELAKEAVAHFGSGWAWLVLDGGALKITSLHDGDTPAAHDGLVPLFTLDVWEHAYYIDYRNARPKFVEAVLGSLINWSFVESNLDGKGLARADQS